MLLLSEAMNHKKDTSSSSSDGTYLQSPLARRVSIISEGDTLLTLTSSKKKSISLLSPKGSFPQSAAASTKKSVSKKVTNLSKYLFTISISRNTICWLWLSVLQVKPASCIFTFLSSSRKPTTYHIPSLTFLILKIKQLFNSRQHVLTVPLLAVLPLRPYSMEVMIFARRLLSLVRRKISRRC
jgi:hypothetical protein